MVPDDAVTFSEITVWLQSNKDLVVEKSAYFLTWAVRHEKLELMIYLLHLGCDVNAVYDQQRSPLFYAVSSKAVILVDVLMMYGAQQFPDALGNTPLHYAVVENNNEAVTCLVKFKDINLSHKNNDGLTVIQLTLKKGHYSCLEEIFTRYTRVNVLFSTEDLLAVRSHEGISSNLQSIATLYLIANGRIDLLSSDFDWDTRDHWGRDIVLLAVATGQRNLLKRLVAPVDEGGYGRSISVKTNNENGPVLVAIQFDQQDMLKELLKPECDGVFTVKK